MPLKQNQIINNNKWLADFLAVTFLVGLNFLAKNPIQEFGSLKFLVKKKTTFEREKSHIEESEKQTNGNKLN